MLSGVWYDAIHRPWVLSDRAYRECTLCGGSGYTHVLTEKFAPSYTALVDGEHTYHVGDRLPCACVLDGAVQQREVRELEDLWARGEPVKQHVSFEELEQGYLDSLERQSGCFDSDDEESYP